MALQLAWSVLFPIPLAAQESGSAPDSTNGQSAANVSKSDTKESAADQSAQDAEGEAEQDAEIEDRFGDKKRPAPDHAYAEYQKGNYLSAFAVALPLAEAGDAAAQTLIAELYEKGLGIARDREQSAVWYGIAAEAGNREAQFAYALKLMKGDHVEQDYDRGIAMMQKAADAGHPVAMYNYASHLIDRRPTSAGYRKALPYFEKAAEHRLADAFYSLSQIYMAGLADGIQRPEKGQEWLERAARSGVDTAQIELALDLLQGTNGKKDEKAAFKWFRAAAMQGNVIARNRLAYMYWKGLGTEQSSVQAAMWHILARRGGRLDPELDRFMELLDKDTRRQAIALAERWPTGRS